MTKHTDSGAYPSGTPNYALSTFNLISFFLQMGPNKLERYITFGRKVLPVTNTLAYWANTQVTKKIKCCEYCLWPCPQYHTKSKNALAYLVPLSTRFLIRFLYRQNNFSINVSIFCQNHRKRLWFSLSIILCPQIVPFVK